MSIGQKHLLRVLVITICVSGLVIWEHSASEGAYLERIANNQVSSIGDDVSDALVAVFGTSSPDMYAVNILQSKPVRFTDQGVPLLDEGEKQLLHIYNVPAEQTTDLQQTLVEMWQHTRPGEAYVPVRVITYAEPFGEWEAVGEPSSIWEYHETITTFNPSDRSTDEELDQKFINYLDKAALILIQDGINAAAHSEAAWSEFQSRFTDRYALWPRANIDYEYGKYRQIAEFTLFPRDLHYEIRVTHQATVDETVYDFWVVKKTAHHGTPIGSHSCMFYVTSASNQHGARTIETQSRTFIPSFVTVDGETIAFPQADKEVLYRLEAWKFPECYPASTLPETVIDLSQEVGYFEKAESSDAKSLIWKIWRSVFWIW